MISDVFNQVVKFVTDVIGVGSTAANGGFEAVVGSLGNIFG